MNVEAEDSGAEAAAMPPPPAEFYRANDGRIYPRPRPLQERIRRLRSHAETLCNQTLWYACSLIGLIGLVTAYLMMTAYSDAWLIFVALCGSALVIGAIIEGVKRGFRNLQRHWRDELHSSQLPLAVVDDQFWHQIFAAQQASPWLKWAQVHPPRSLEEHLSFAAAYFESLRWLLRTPGELPAREVAGGNCLWHAGRPWCFVCAFISCGVPIGWATAFPIYLIYAMRAQIHKAGRLAALCDFFLGDHAPPN